MKLWDAVLGTELRSFGGHTGTVTAVILLSPHDSHRIGKLGVQQVPFGYPPKLLYLVFYKYFMWR